jgi:hypothetical protein
MSATKVSILFSLRVTPEELAAAQWLAKQTKRTRNNAIIWAVCEKASELGYAPKVTPKKK